MQEETVAGCLRYFGVVLWEETRRIIKAEYLVPIADLGC